MAYRQTSMDGIVLVIGCGCENKQLRLQNDINMRINHLLVAHFECSRRVRHRRNERVLSMLNINHSKRKKKLIVYKDLYIIGKNIYIEVGTYKEI